MPNWCKGNLKIRGKKEDIVNFLEKGTCFLSDSFELKEINPEVKLNEDYVLEIKNINKEKGMDFLYIRGTHRNFIDPIEDEVYLYGRDEKEAIAILKNFKAAWGIDEKRLAIISEAFNIDLKIYGFEKGLEFNQDIEIVKGEIVKNKKIKFKNYQWECTNPEIGG